MPMDPVLELRDISKTYGRVRACSDICFSVMPGEIRGLLGQNGAGKSTLMRIAAGLVEADRGAVLVHGKELPPGSPRAASVAGVGMVHQHFSLVEALTVWENVTLGDVGRLSATEAISITETLAERYGLEVDAHSTVEHLAPGERQRVEIIKCLRSNPTVIILDEPTAVLTQIEAKRLFAVLRLLAQDDVPRAIVLISHRLEEVLDFTERVTVLRDGQVATTLRSSDADITSLAVEMLGRDVSLGREAGALGLPTLEDEVRGRWDTSSAKLAPSADRARFAMVDVSARGSDGTLLLNELSLRVSSGEIVGLAGVEGNGQAAIADVVSGIVELDGGQLLVDGGPVVWGRRGNSSAIGLVPADRQVSGCVLPLSVAENLVLDCTEDVMSCGLISRRLLRDRAKRLIEEFGISTPSIHTPVAALSGGNQQRVVLARELSKDPSVLVASQPTQGLDIEGIEDVWRRLREAATRGVAVLVISSDLDEIVALADRVAVISRGAIVGELARHELNHERLGLMMGGQSA